MSFFHSLVIVLLYFMVAVSQKPHSYVWKNPAKGICLTITIVTGIMAQIKARQFWKNCTNCGSTMITISENSIKEMSLRLFEIGQPVMVWNHAHHKFEPKYLLDYRVLQILNDSTLLLVNPDGKDRKTNINDVKLCSP